MPNRPCTERTVRMVINTQAVHLDPTPGLNSEGDPLIRRLMDQVFGRRLLNAAPNSVLSMVPPLRLESLIGHVLGIVWDWADQDAAVEPEHESCECDDQPDLLSDELPFIAHLHPAVHSYAANVAIALIESGYRLETAIVMAAVTRDAALKLSTFTYPGELDVPEFCDPLRIVTLGSPMSDVR